MTDPDQRAALHLAQRIARVLRTRAGLRRLSMRALARRAGVHRDQAELASSGEGWIALYTAQRLLRAVDCELVVQVPPDPDDEAS